jgi:predicted nuclease of predicted toxin-antitoxin system
VRLLIDEMFDPAIAKELRRRGHDAVSVAEIAATRGVTDEEVFALAQEQGRAVVTESVPDFATLAGACAAAGRPHFGVIYTTNRKFPRARRSTAGRVVAALAQLLKENEDEGDERVSREMWL